MSIKISKKNLINEAEALGAYKLDGNIYLYENDIHYITAFDHNIWNKDVTNNNGCYSKNLQGFLDILSKNIDNKKHSNIYSDCIAYSVGIYGNIARLDKIRLMDKDWNEYKTFYIYY